MLRSSNLLINSREFTTANSNNKTSPSAPSSSSSPSSSSAAVNNALIVIDLLFHTSSFAKVLSVADPLEIIGTQNERNAFLELKNIFSTLLHSSSGENIYIQPFLDKLSLCTNVDYGKPDTTDILSVWDDIVKLVMVVIPPLREVFLGQVASAQEVPGWLNLMSRCFRAHFTDTVMTLEDVCRSSILHSPGGTSGGGSLGNGNSGKSSAIGSNGGSGSGSGGGTLDAKGQGETPTERLRASNAMVLKRAPEILVVSVESALLNSQDHHRSLSPQSKPPSAIRFPGTFDLSSICPPSLPSSSSIAATNSNAVTAATGSSPSNGATNAEVSRVYDLSSVVVLEGSNFGSVQSYFKLNTSHSNSNGNSSNNSSSSSSSSSNSRNSSGTPSGNDEVERWFRGAGSIAEEVSKTSVIEGSYYSTDANSSSHPRLLVYTRRDLPIVLERTIQLVSKAGQLRALGDVAFALAMTTENYGEARRCYEEAIALDETLRPILQENLNSLEKIERTQKARVLEEQADLALANKRFKECSDMYTRALNSAIVSSGVYVRVREKLDNVSQIITLESSCHCAEKGEDALKAGVYNMAKDHFSLALKLNPTLIHLHTILVGIDKTVQLQSAAQKTAEAQHAMKVGKFRLANQLFREVVVLVPEKQEGLQSFIDSLGPLMQGEDASIRHRAGLSAIEDKRYPAAVSLVTEAIELLPPNSNNEKALYLCDRAQAHYEMKDFNSAITDCQTALELKSDLAIAHFRLGISQFGLDLYDDASASYDKALRHDSSLGEAIKLKIRQVNTAKEVQQRKEREAERARIKEEERKALEEKRVREDLIKKEKAEKAAKEKAEKAERARNKEEERRANALREKELQEEAKTSKEADKEKQRLEKIERDAQKALDRERLRAEKEREREKSKLEKEQKELQENLAKQEEKQRQREFAAEMERAAAKQREAEREKELEREKARLERERLVAEREKARQEKLAAEAAKKKQAEQEKNAATKSTSAPVSSVSSSGSLSVTPATVSSSTAPPQLTKPSISSPVVSVGKHQVEQQPVQSRWSAAPLRLSADPPPPPPPPLTSPKPVLPDFPTLAETLKEPSAAARRTSATAATTVTTPTTTAMQPNNQRNQQQFSLLPPAAASSSSLSTAPLAASASASFDGKQGQSVWGAKEATMWRGDAGNGSNNAKSGGAYGNSGIGGGNFNISNGMSTSSRSNSKDNGQNQLTGNGGMNMSNVGGSRLNNSSLSTASFNTGNIFSEVNSSSMSVDFEFQPSPEVMQAAERKRLADVQQKAAAAQAIAAATLTPPKATLSSARDALHVPDLFGSLSSTSSASTSSSTSGLGGDPFGGVGLGLGQSSGFGGFGGLGFSTSSFLSSTAAGNNSPDGEFPDLYSSDFEHDSIRELGLDDPIAIALGGLSGLGDSLLAPSLTRGTSYNSSAASGLGLGNVGLSMDSSSLHFSLGSGATSSSSSSSNSLATNGLGFMDQHLTPNHTHLSPGLYSSKLDLDYPNLHLPPAVGRPPQGSMQQLGSIQSFASASGLGIDGSSSLSSSAYPSFHPSSSQPHSQFALPPPIGGRNLPSAPMMSSSSSSSSSPPSSSASVATGSTMSVGIDGDVLPEHVFSSVAWLRQYGMHMYHWAGNSNEWTDYGMHLPEEVLDLLLGQDRSRLTELSNRSGCKMWLDKEILRGQQATFLVLHRGESGQPSNTCMTNALDLVSNLMRQLLQQGDALSK